MEDRKDDKEAVKQFGIEFGVDVCRKLLDSKKINVLHFYTLNLEKVVYGVLDGLGLSENALASSNEADEASMVAKGSAWARVGDKVKTEYGLGEVMKLDNATGAATVQIQSWVHEGKEDPTVHLEKGKYTKEM
jgi:hypothetical protein